MTFSELETQFSQCPNWQERYRLLIQLSRLQPAPSEETLASWQEVHGCESHLWVKIGASPSDFQAYSNARIMQGVLQLLMIYTQTCPPPFDFQAVLNALHIAPQLSVTRQNALRQIEQLLQQNCA